MTTHVFIVNDFTFQVHLEYLFAGTGASDKRACFLSNYNTRMHHSTERLLVGMISDVSRISVGDNIIFYLQSSNNKPGTFFGTFKAASRAFYDDNDEENYLKQSLRKGLSFRVLIQPYIVFEKGITEFEYLDSLEGKEKPQELCWSLIYRKLKGHRGCTMITDYEYNDLFEKLMIKNNNTPLQCHNFSFDKENRTIIKSDKNHNYIGRMDKLDINDRLLYKFKNNNAFESHLQAYILQNISDSNLNKLILINPGCDYWIGNEVSCGVGMQKMDILIIQENEREVNFIVIELKDEEPTIPIIEAQLPRYVEWLSYYIIPNYKSTNKKIIVTPTIIAKKTENLSLLKLISSTAISNHFSNIEIKVTRYIYFELASNKITFHCSNKI